VPACHFLTHCGKLVSSIMGRQLPRIAWPKQFEMPLIFVFGQMGVEAMSGSDDLFFVHQQVAPKVQVIRFVKPDLRKQLDPIVEDNNLLLQEIAGVLEGVPDGGQVIFNFGLVERFPTSFFQLMMRARQQILARNGRICLCCFRQEIVPSVELMGGSRLFSMTNSEETAIREAQMK
jgi:anti-anti-sigma regulatory factor